MRIFKKQQPKTEKPKIRAVLTCPGGNPNEIHKALVELKQNLLGTSAPIIKTL